MSTPLQPESEKEMNKLRKDLVTFLRVAKTAENDLQLIPTLDDLIAYIQANYIPRDVVREAIGENYVFERPKNDYLPNVYNFLKGKNELRDDLINSLGLDK